MMEKLNNMDIKLNLINIMTTYTIRCIKAHSGFKVGDTAKIEAPAGLLKWQAIARYSPYSPFCWA